MSKQRKRGTRRIVGYVVSLSGKRGGPYASEMHAEPALKEAARYDLPELRAAQFAANWWKAKPRYPHARVLPVVRYELDREEERLRDAVVEAVIRWRETGKRLFAATDALRAHLEKKG